MLLNMAHAAAPFSVAMQPIDRPELVFDGDAVLTRYDATPAMLHIPVPESSARPYGPDGDLQAAGAVSGVTAIDKLGLVSSGDLAMAMGGGQVLLSVQPGPAVVAMKGAFENAAVLEHVAASADIGLTGRHMVVAIAPGPARLLHLTTSTPVVLRDSWRGVQLFAAGADTDVFQPKQNSPVMEFSALGGQGLTGTAHFTSIAPVPITDGLGPAMLVPPGESRLFTFTLSAARTVGVGVRGSVDDATTRLLGADGTDLGSGVIHMHHLDAGTYFLTVEVPADGVATLVRPALVGVTLPDDGPPPDVQAEYESGEGAE